jgi:hypothetical protein
MNTPRKSRGGRRDSDKTSTCFRQSFGPSRVAAVAGVRAPVSQLLLHRPPRPHLVVDGVLATQRRVAFEILAYLGGTVMDFIGRAIDVFGSPPDIVVNSGNLGFACRRPTSSGHQAIADGGSGSEAMLA